VTPYYDSGGIAIYHGDCREVLAELDLERTVLLTDPPYGVASGAGSGTQRARGKARYEITAAWSDDEAYIASVCAPVVDGLLGRVIRGAITPGTRCMTLYPRPADVGVLWAPSGAGMSYWGFNCAHLIFYYGRDPRCGIAPSPNSRQVTEAAEVNGHPCPKPISAWRWLARKVSVDGDLILDPFMGSGTTLRAAKDLGRRAIGIEIEERYCEIAANRLSQGVLFGAEVA
jgi:site-specific DNA-methyltransferase (adenine-specific)